MLGDERGRTSQREGESKADATISVKVQFTKAQWEGGKHESFRGVQGREYRRKRAANIQGTARAVIAGA